VRISSTARTITVPTAPYVSDANTLVLQSYTNNFTSAGSTSVTWTVGSAGPSVQRFSPFNPTAAYSTSTVGGSGYFDGSGDYLTTPSNVALNISGGGSFTIECWAYLNNNSGNDQNLMIGDNAGSQYWDLRVSGSTLVFRWNNAANSITSNTSWYFGCWNHCAVSWDGTTMRMFVNGILQSSTSTTAIASHTTSVMYIGYSNYAPIPQHPLGYICDTRIVKGSAVYTTTFTPPTAPLTAITNTSLLLNYTNAGIYDSAMMNDLETVSGAKLSTSVKKYGTASISFNGTSDYLQITNSLTAKFGTGDFTIEAWIYKTASQNGAIIDARPSPTAQPWAFSCDASNYPYFYDGGVYTSSIAVSLNTWTHVAVVRSSNVLKIYVNGVQGYSTAYTLTVDGGPSIQIGGPAAFFPGYMDDIRITKGYARYTSSFTPPTAALPNY
jgi:hypothetical protein